ncbi:unnamed protein product [Microthlaspi erraticum]|uniref:Uncharacterized protein n=1 Tax=Microthlaspi erraticum TaxID=1685480 RepID=A0A6D2LG78_9BRAS|nr:unnamed protein product [Microthlaspi erraticum]
MEKSNMAVISQTLKNRLIRHSSVAVVPIMSNIEDLKHNQIKHASDFSKWKMRTKEEAEALEAKLLCTYDYAWNISSNGERRRPDLLKKIDGLTLNSKQSASLLL